MQVERYYNAMVKRSNEKKINAMHCNVEKFEEVIRMDASDLAKRMKRYEAVSKTTLVTRMPVILRIDGKAFHTLTRGFQKPFDRVLNLSMMETIPTTILFWMQQCR